METPTRKPIDADVEEVLVAAARRFMALHPDVEAVAMTVVSRLIDPRELCAVIVGRDGPIVTPNAWALVGDRMLDGVAYCIDQVKGLLLGLSELANGMARTVEGFRHGQQLQEAAPAAAASRGGDRGDG